MAAFHIPTAEEVAAAQYAPMPLLSAAPPPPSPPPLPPAPPARRPTAGTATIVVRPRAPPSRTPPPPPQPRTVRPAPAPGVVVHPRQRGNPLLARLRGVAWAFAAGDAAARQTADYCVGARTGVLFLSLQFHLLDPAYVVARLLAMRTCYTLRILLVLCDIPEEQGGSGGGCSGGCSGDVSSNDHGTGPCTTGATAALEELNVLCVQQDTTLVLAWSNDEAAQYVAALKLLEHRSAAAIREHMPGEEDTLARVVDCLTQIRSVNRTDALALMKHFGVCCPGTPLAHFSFSLSLSSSFTPKLTHTLVVGQQKKKQTNRH